MDNDKRRTAWTVALYTGVAVLMLFQLLAVLHLNDGKFCYTLDDPYIHLALAENLAAGHYGMAPGQVTAASSSVIWPFLLAIFSWTGVLEWIPLIVNVAAAFAAVDLLRRCALRCLEPAEVRTEIAAVILAAALVCGTNVVGAAFGGMEHALQLTVTLACGWGLLRLVDDGLVPTWLVPALVAGPLLRYENLAVSVPVLVALLLLGKRTAAAAGAASIAATLGAFSLTLHANGMGWLPTSVAAKSRLVAADAAPGSLLINVLQNLEDRQGAAVAVVAAVLCLVTLASGETRTRIVGAVAIAACAMHYAGGAFGFGRYELYIVGFLLVSILYVARSFLRRLAGASSPFLFAGALGIATVAVAQPYVYGLYTGPIAANNIYEQQYQMHRFVTEFYPATVAANDIGWISFENPNTILDLWGISSPDVLARRNASRDVQWIDDLAIEYGAEYAILYDLWFPRVPAGWTRVAEMSLSRRRVSPAASTVVFYAIRAETLPLLRQRLREYEPSLPPGVRLEYVD